MIVEAKIIVPDSSHWAKWIDATGAADPLRRRAAQDLHQRLLKEGRIPLLTWHHLEELLAVDDDQTARNRVEFIKALPLIAWLRLPGQREGLGSIIDVLAAEAMAASEGNSDLLAVRDRARQLLLQTGSGSDAIGEESWVWEAIRPAVRLERPQKDVVAALSPMRMFDENRTIGELTKLPVNSADQMKAQLPMIYTKALGQATIATGGDAEKAKAMAKAFVARVVDLLPPAGTTVRDLLVSTLVSQGLNAEEVTDDSVLADLTELALFRSQLRVAATAAGLRFDQLKHLPEALFPSRVIGDALKRHGQQRRKRPGSDLNDAYLGVLAAYSGVLYVDRRTAEDFQRARRKEPRLVGLIGEVAKASDFYGLSDKTHV